MNAEDQPLTTQAALGANHIPDNQTTPVPERRPYVISHKDFYCLSLHLSGYSAEDIAEIMGYSSKFHIYHILNKKEVIQVRQQLMASLEQEFEAFQAEVFSLIKTKMHSTDERVQLEAINIWMRYHGKFDKKLEKETLSAEDIVKSFLNPQINIQVNVGDRDNGK